MIILAMIFSVAGVIAEDSSGNSGSSDSGSGSSGSSDSESISSSTDHTNTSEDHSGSSADHSSSGSGSDTSAGTSKEVSGSKDSGFSSSSLSSSPDMSTSDSSGQSSPDAAEVEIEHGISTITAQENSQISSLNAEHASHTVDPAMQSSMAATVATTSLSSLSTVPGNTASELAAEAATIQDSMSRLSASETAIQTRSGFFTTLFGGDTVAASDIETEVSKDMASLDAMDKLVNDPLVSPSLKAFTLQREATIRAELERLNGVASTEMQKKGLLSGLFGK
jgi:hypothetical protein